MCEDDQQSYIQTERGGGAADQAGVRNTWALFQPTLPLRCSRWIVVVETDGQQVARGEVVGGLLEFSSNDNLSLPESTKYSRGGYFSAPTLFTNPTLSGVDG